MSAEVLSLARAALVDVARLQLHGTHWLSAFAGTAGAYLFFFYYLIAGPNKKVLFIPDIDQWQKWSRNIRTLAEQVDILLLDGTFASASEIPGRSIADIPHPLMSATRELLKGTRAELWFIHLNHTNQQIVAKDVVKDGQRFPL